MKVMCTREEYGSALPLLVKEEPRVMEEIEKLRRIMVDDVFGSLDATEYRPSE
jgi:hypothetical protein